MGKNNNNLVVNALYCHYTLDVTSGLTLFLQTYAIHSCLYIRQCSGFISFEDHGYTIIYIDERDELKAHEQCINDRYNVVRCICVTMGRWWHMSYINQPGKLSIKREREREREKSDARGNFNNARVSCLLMLANISFIICKHSYSLWLKPKQTLNFLHDQST